MSDERPTRAQVWRWVKKDVEGWRPALGLEDWTVHIQDACRDVDHLGQATCDWQYLEATLCFDCNQLRDTTDVNGSHREGVRLVVMHELVHIMLSGYQAHHRMEQLERATTMISRSLYRCWKAKPPV